MNFRSLITYHVCTTTAIALTKHPTNYADIDDEITPRERERVEALVNEQSVPASSLHPSVDRLLPLSSSLDRHLPPCALLNDIERYEAELKDHEEDGTAAEPSTILKHPISLSRYTDFEHDGVIDYNAMYTALSYAILRDRNSSFDAQNRSATQALEEGHLETLNNLVASLKSLISQKRERIDDFESARKKRQLDFQPVNEFLSQSWRDGITAMVDAGLDRRLSK